MYIGTVDEMVHETAILGLKLDREAKLYTHPKQWQGLSDDEIQNELKKMWDKGLIPSHNIVLFARAIEAKLREKNG